MKRNGLGNLYDRLDPEERFRADLLAMARGDMEESERLDELEQLVAARKDKRWGA